MTVVGHLRRRGSHPHYGRGAPVGGGSGVCDSAPPGGAELALPHPVGHNRILEPPHPGRCRGNASVVRTPPVTGSAHPWLGGSEYVTLPRRVGQHWRCPAPWGTTACFSRTPYVPALRRLAVRDSAAPSVTVRVAAGAPQYEQPPQ